MRAHGDDHGETGRDISRLFERDTGRLEALSDGVFAVAMTLLVLTLHVPPFTPRTGLLTALLAHWPDYLTYAVSFLTVLIMWTSHHNIFKHIARTDHPFLLLNGLLLLGVTVVPFPTALLAAYIQHPEHHDQTVAAVVYGGVFAVIALLFNLLWWYAVRHNRLLEPDADPQAVRTITQQYALGPPIYLASVVVALFSAQASLAIDMSLTAFYVLPLRTVTRLWRDVERVA